jgi:FkbM family methyltransferase
MTMRDVDALFEDIPLRIVDIGASGGLHRRWPALTRHVEAIMFEPDAGASEDLRTNSSSKTVVLGCALAEAPGPVDFYRCRKQQVSSVYAPDLELLTRYPYPERFSLVEKISMNADTLDHQLQQAGVEAVDFIKLDTQGCELSILRGSLNSLATVIGLEVEVEFVPLYKGQPLFGEVDSFARSLDFSLIDLRRTYWRRGNSSEYGRNKGQLVTGDALYLRLPEQILAMPGLTSQRVVRTVGIYLAYGYLDLAQALVDGAERAGLPDAGRLRQAAAVIARLKSHWMPDFTGRRRLRRILQRITDLFADQGPYTGADGDLGNARLSA